VDWLKKETLASLSSNKKGQAPSGPDLDVKDPSFNANLRALAELAKTKLSVDESVTLRIPGAGPWAEGKRGPLLLEMSRDKFEELSNELWQRCRLPLDQVGPIYRSLDIFLWDAYLA
jgi:molecular chaperone DnaK (HSP70)